ncbi:MAG: hypothetical protein II165_03615, partial [Bacteroidales bacterium]|nr:hypothetical protein [Bacteroidales bacterium]
YIMVPCYAASPYDDTGWTEPEDSAENKVLISVHAYTPYKFCMSDSSNSTFETGDEGRDIEYYDTKSGNYKKIKWNGNGF